MNKCKLLMKLFLLILSITNSSMLLAQKLKSKVISIELPSGKTINISPAPKRNQYDRTLLNLREKARYLPGSKGSPSPSPPPPSPSPSPVNCAGSWSGWSTCNGGTQSRTYTVTTQPSNGGTACPSSPESQSCGATTTTLSPQTTTTTGASSQPLLETSKIAISWDYMVQPGAKWFNVSEMSLVHCEIGQTVEISWSNTNIEHDIHELYSYSSYIDCDFSNGQKRIDAGNSGNYTFKCNTMGTKFFSCSVGTACAAGKQRIRVHGIDSRKTSALSSAGHSTLAGYMKESVTVYKGGNILIPESKANTMEQMLLSIASNSPASCSDWLIPSHLSNTTCLGYVYTDLGVLYRQRVSNDLEKAKMYYDKALQLIPDFCLAESYLVELQMKKNDKSAADVQFEVACKACGKSNLDMEIIRMAYKAKGWALPQASNCNPLKQNAVVKRNSKGNTNGALSSTNETVLLSSGRNMASRMGFIWYCGAILITTIILF